MLALKPSSVRQRHSCRTAGLDGARTRGPRIRGNATAHGADVIFKVVYKRAGGHVFMRLWCGEQAGQLALSGQLTMRNDEFDSFRNMLSAGHGLMDTVVFEEQITSAPATRGNNDFRPA